VAPCVVSFRLKTNPKKTVDSSGGTPDQIEEFRVYFWGKVTNGNVD